MRGSLRLGRVFGIELFLHPAFLVLGVGALLWWLFLSPRNDPSAEILFVAVVFASACVHAGGHAAAARALRLRTTEVQLLPFASIERLETRPAEPFHAFLIALAGPAANAAFAICVVAGLLAAGNGVGEILTSLVSDAVRFLVWSGVEGAAPPPGPGVLLFEVNLGLALWSLLPAFPMDGGPACRAILTALLGRGAAVRISGRIAAVTSVAIALLGFFVNNLLLGLIGFFVYLMSRNETAFLGARLLVEGLPVRAALTTRFDVLATYESLGQAARALLCSTQNDFPVVGDDGRFLGMLRRNDLLKALDERGADSRVIDAARRGEPTLDPTDRLDRLLDHWTAFPASSIPVLEDGALVGLLNAEGIQKLLLVRGALGGAWLPDGPADAPAPRPRDS